MKRNGFVSIQNAHTISCAGYHQPYVQTGYESLTLQRCDKMFGLAAKQNGKVIQLTEKAVRVVYEDGTEDSCPLGRQYGSAEGATYPHDIVPMVTEGAKFKKGDAICYHTGFFEPDFLDPKNVVMKFGMAVETAFMESARTHEDSCSISKKLASKLKSKTTKVKSYVVKFEQALHNVQKPGVNLEPEDVLLVIENEITVGVGNFDAESMATLKNAGTPAPRSSYTGTLDRIDVYYHGDKGDMHPSLKSLADRSDRMFSEQERDLGKTALTGRVDGDFSVKGKPLLLNQAEVRFYITVEHEMSPGDKGVFANQLKTTVGEEMAFEMVTESGIEVDAMFGGRSALKRITNSYALIGTATGNLQATADHMVKMWEGV